MKVKTAAVLSLVGLAISATPTLARAAESVSSADQRAALVARFEAARQDCWREAQVSRAKGPLLAQHMNRQRRLSDLINRIQIGEVVSAEEIDQALQPVIR